MGAMAAIHGLGMFAAFSKFTNIFDPAKMQAKLRHKKRLNKLRR